MFPAHHLRLHCRRSVEHSSADQRLEATHTEASVRHACCNDDGTASDFTTVLQSEDAYRPVLRQRSGRIAVDEVRSKDPGLPICSPGELRTADSAGEPKVVPDERAGPRLAAERLPLEQCGRQAFCGTIHRRGKSSWAGPSDDYVICALAWPDVDTQRGCHLQVGGIDQHHTVVEGHNGSLGSLQAKAFQNRPALL